MLLSTFSSAVVALSVLAPSVMAIPTWPGWSQNQPRYTTPNLSRLASKMPESTLPKPDGLQLKFVGLGIGTQNYTCGTNATAEPGSNGAIAKLYDLGTSLNNDPLAEFKIRTLSGLALNLETNTRALDALLAVGGYKRILGDHFFTQASVPTFSLNKVQTTPFPLASVKKNAFMDAPKSACPGINKEGAVQWLHLIDNGSSQGGVNTVYRIETAGGNKPKTCKGMKSTFEVKYAAQYWVFGPKE